MHRKHPRPSCGASDSSAAGRLSPPIDNAAGPAGELDLRELLEVCGFARWHDFLQSLFQRYAGWMSHYWLEEGFDLDFWPTADVIHTLLALPIRAYGDDWAFAAALARCDFLARLARDTRTGSAWDPLSETYRDFQLTHASEPYWGEAAPWPEAEFAGWAVAQVQASPT